MKTLWTVGQIIKFASDHEKRMEECGYPDAVMDELRSARKKWLGALPKMEMTAKRTPIDTEIVGAEKFAHLHYKPPT